MKTLLLILAAAAAAQPAQQFDLVCSGTQKFDLLEPGTPTTFRLRIDLDAGKWCEDAPPGVNVVSCTVLRPIADIQPGLITFEKESDEQKARGQQNTAMVSRQDGKYLRYVNDHRGSVIAIEATCEKQSFSGFPKIETKF